MPTYHLCRILLVNSLLIIAFNGLFYWQLVKTLLDQRQAAILIGLVFYIIQFTATYLLLGKEKPCLFQPFQGKHILQALGAMVIVQAGTVCLIIGLTTHHQTTSVSNQVIPFLPVFVLNSLPGALLEEWLFRYLPLRFGQQAKKRYQSILFVIGALILFTFIHIPAYLLQYDLGLTGLGQVFIMGLFFLTVYLLTQNLIFTALFHGLTNKPLYLIDSPYYWFYFYVSVLIVSLCWALLIRRRRSNSITA